MPHKKETKTKTKRRAHNEGSIYFRKDVGLWYGKVVTGRKADGSPQHTYVKGEKQDDVRIKVNALAGEVNINGFSVESSREDTNFKHLFSEWYDVFKAEDLADVTDEKNRSIMSLHIFPVFGKLDVKDIDTMRIQRFVNKMKREKLTGGFGYSNDSSGGYSADYIKKTKSLLDQFFKYAIRKNLVKTNPVSDVTVGSVEHNGRVDPDDEGKALRPELRVSVFEAVESNSVLKPILMTLSMQGLRTQELIALKWKNVDFDKKEIRVRQAVNRTVKRDESGNIIERGSKVGRVKTASSIRDIAMPQVLLDVLHAWREYCKLKGIKTDKEAFVFPNTDRGKKSERRSYSSLRSMFQRFVAKNGLKEEGLTLYMFRHTFATMLLEEKVNPKIVSEMMGHANIKTTLDIYSTVFKTVYAEAADTLGNAFKRIYTKENPPTLARV